MDPQTIGVIATTAVGILSSYLVKAGRVAAKKIGEDIYHTLKTHLEKKPVAEEALTDLENTPSDADLQAALRVHLKKLLAEDEAFAAELEHLLQEAGATEAGATVIKQVAGDNAKQFGQVFGNISFEGD